MRAATVRINDVSGVAGFVQPNDSVDVLITRQIAGADRDMQVTDVLLQNVRVIAIDQQAKNADGTPKVAQDRDARGHAARRAEARAGAAGRRA